MSDEAMAKLPQRSLGGVGKKTVVRTIASGLVADLGPRVRRTGGGGGAPPDAGRAREEARRAGMSEEDRAWEDASLGRDRAARGRGADAPGGPGGA